MLLVEHALKFGITLAPGSYYRPNGEASPWVRINTAHTDDPRAIRFLEHMGKGAGKP
jgi:DNA-binding transcriptional MocR family regulator